MEINYSHPNQTSRFIAVGRLGMVALSLFAIHLDPAEPVSNFRIIESILLWYLAYAIVLAVFLWRMDISWIYLKIVIHIIDLTIAVLLIFFTTGPASPFFAYFIFSLISATLGWQWRGALYTAAIVTAVMLVTAVCPVNMLQNPGFALDSFVIRIGYIPVVAGLLAYLSAHEHEQSRMAAAEERLNLCRDLHDGLLQSLAGTALQLETARQLLENNPQAAQQRIIEIQKLIYNEQQELRSHIQHLKTPSEALPEFKENLIIRLEDLAARIERQWGPRVKLDVQLNRKPLSVVLSHGVYMIVHEAVVNAARRAKASSISAAIISDPQSLRIVVTDNGSGFPFRGRYDQSALLTMNTGPVSLRERVAFLGGKLTIESSDLGASIEIVLPLMEKSG